MTINAIKSDDRPSIGWATVTMSLEEIEKLRGALCSIGDKSRLHADFFLLFELVQKGVVDDMTHGICIELARKRDETEFEEQKDEGVY